jgi:hypothetical protein
MNCRVLWFEVYKAIEQVIFDHFFVLYSHVPTALGTILAGFNLDKARLSAIEEVDQDVNLTDTLRGLCGHNSL